VCARWSQEYGQHELRFAAFQEMFPTFPFVFGCHMLQGLAVPWSTKPTPITYAVHTDTHSVEAARYTKFDAVPFVVAYKELYEQLATFANGRSIALVFPRKGFLHGMVLHDDQSEQYWPQGLAEVYKFTAGGRDRRLYRMPFTALVAAIASQQWKP
jgi:hypothetical protein